MNSPRKIVIVGASLAGLRGAENLRRAGYDGRLVLVGAEPHLPYDRPPLSKEILQGTWDADRIPLRRQPYEELDLELRLGTRATGLDPSGRVVELAAGAREEYDALLIASGAAARSLPGQPDLEGIHLLRTLDDSLAIRGELEGSPRVLVVGAGFIGAEVAASCRQRGLEVTVVEPMPVPLLRGLGQRMGEVSAQIHRDHGVDLRCGIGVTGFEGGSRVERVRLSDGSSVEADVVVVGVGAAPVTDWLESSGLPLEDGVVCDAHCRTPAPGVFAAGDVARFHNPIFDEVMRIEHWSNAAEQSVAATDNMLAGEAAQPYRHVPWFWSDQYDVKIQFAGRLSAEDRMQVVWGSIDERKFVALYGRAGRLVGVLAFNRPRALIQYKKLIGEGANWEEAVGQN
ncbi:MAG: FAD-dependent oxidoreductase [Proteobacteria bacterium]|nr:FAD-dependent oxidoreductase [Pseudomonadota bacterium]